MVRIVASGGNFYRLPPDKEKTVYTNLFSYSLQIMTSTKEKQVCKNEHGV